MLITEQFWWFLTRSSSLIAWFLLSVTVIWGILLSTRIFRKFDNPAWLQELHRYLSTLGYVFVLIHIFSLYMDTYIQFSLSDMVIPFQAQYARADVANLGNLPTALGVLSLHLMTLIVLTSWMMRRIPRKFWKYIHLQSYVLILAISLHAGWTGSDTQSTVYRYFSIGLIVLTTIAVLIRVFYAKSATSLANTIERRPHFSERLIPIQITSRRKLTDRIVELQLSSDEPLPKWTPGAHISIALPNGLTRQYSLCGDPADGFYTIAVEKSFESKGGSSYIFDKVKLGQELQISPPRNHFELEVAHSYLFVAGGIGITPIKAMIDSMPTQRPWQLLYLGDSLRNMAFAQELVAMYGDRIRIHTSTEGSNHFDFNTLPKNEFELVYACASDRVLAALSDSVSSDKLRTEKFTARTFDNLSSEEFQIECTVSNKTINVRSDESALEALEQANVKVYASCRTGTCGACELPLLAGDPDHRDSMSRKSGSNAFYPCVSRATSTKISLEV
jgi:ferredoxin-NADP reductase/DMSO/TMAO reductase YedYZ heme-binding membrane subunit